MSQKVILPVSQSVKMIFRFTVDQISEERVLQGACSVKTTETYSVPKTMFALS